MSSRVQRYARNLVGEEVDFDEIMAPVREHLEKRGELMAKKRKSEEDEIDELIEDLDELEDSEAVDDDDDEEDEDEELEDEDEDEDEDDDEEDVLEDDPDEKPRRRARTRKRGGRVATKAKKKSRKAAEDGVGTAEVADELGITPRALRALLRNRGIQADREGRYHWKSMDSPEIRKLRKLVEGGAVQEATAERLEKVKKSRKKKSAAKKSGRKKSSARKKR